MYFKSCLLLCLLLVACSQCRMLARGDGGNFSSPTSTEYVFEVCYKNAGNQGVQKLWAGIDEYRKCLQQLSVSEWNAFDYDSIFDSYCREVDSLKVCSHTLLNTALSCLTSKGRTETPRERKLLNALVDFFCRKGDNQYKILEFASNSSECLEEKKSEIFKCDENRDFFADSSDMEKWCEYLTSSEQCILPPLKSCKDQVAGHYVEEMLKTMKQSISCESVKMDRGNR